MYKKVKKKKKRNKGKTNKQTKKKTNEKTNGSKHESKIDLMKWVLHDEINNACKKKTEVVRKV